MTNYNTVLIRSILSLAITFVCNPVMTLAQGANQDSELDKKVLSIAFKNVSTKVVLTNLIKPSKFEVEFDETVKDSLLTIEKEEITIREFIEIVLEEKKLAARMRDDRTILIFDDTLENRKKFEDLQSWPKKPIK